MDTKTEQWLMPEAAYWAKGGVVCVNQTVALGLKDMGSESEFQSVCQRYNVKTVIYDGGRYCECSCGEEGCESVLWTKLILSADRDLTADRAKKLLMSPTGEQGRLDDMTDQYAFFINFPLGYVLRLADHYESEIGQRLDDLTWIFAEREYSALLEEGEPTYCDCDTCKNKQEGGWHVDSYFTRNNEPSLSTIAEVITKSKRQVACGNSQNDEGRWALVPSCYWSGLVQGW